MSKGKITFQLRPVKTLYVITKRRSVNDKTPKWKKIFHSEVEALRFYNQNLQKNLTITKI